MSYKTGDVVFVRQLNVIGSANYDSSLITASASVTTIYATGLSFYQANPPMANAMGVIIASEPYDRYRVEVDHMYKKVQYIVYASQLESMK